MSGCRVIEFPRMRAAAEAAALVIAAGDAPHALVAMHLARELEEQLAGGLPRDPALLDLLAARCRTLARMADDLRAGMEGRT